MSEASTQSAQFLSEQEEIRAKCFHPAGAFVEFVANETEAPIAERFEKITRLYPKRLALKDGAQFVTYTELNSTVNRIACSIIERFGPGNQPIAVMVQHGVGAIAAVLAVFKAGKILVVLDGSNPRQTNCETLEDCQASAIIADSAHFAAAVELIGARELVLDLDNVDHCTAGENLGLSIAPDQIAQILYTSGSTGRPKGVVWSCRFLLHHAMSAINAGRFSTEDRLSLLFNPGSSMFPQNILRGLLAGASLFPFDLRQNSSLALAKWLAEEEITVYRAFASSFRNLVQCLNEPMKLPRLRLVQVGGESVSKRDVEGYKRWFPRRTLFMHLCGTSETGEIGSYFADHSAEVAEGALPIGVVSQDKDVALVDEFGAHVAANQVGEIIVKSQYLANGYWHDIELTEKKFAADPDHPDRRICRTGDLGRALASGGFLHAGRKDNLVKVRGYRISLWEVETALRAHNNVREVAVTTCDDAQGEKYLAAYLACHCQPGPTVDELLAFLKPTLPAHMLPSAFVYLQAFPQKNGKIDRGALPPPARTRGFLSQAYIPPTSEIERQLASIWEEVLDIRPVGIHDKFLELGGHSLAAARILARIVKRFRFDMPLRSLFESPTVAQMARVIALGENLLLARGRTTLTTVNAPHQYADIAPDRLNRLLIEIETLSEDEASGQLKNASDSSPK